MISLHTVLVERKSALIIVDVQNEFCHPEGGFAKKGMDVSCAAKMMPTLKRLIDSAHRNSVPVIYIANTEDESTDCEAWLCRPDGAEDIPNQGVTRRGTWGTELYDLTPEKDDIVIEKHRFSAFHNTRLDKALRGMGIQTVVVAGLATNVCVQTTATHAVMHGYHVVVAEDACAAWSKEAHEAFLYNIRLFIGKVFNSEQICAEWDRK